MVEHLTHNRKTEGSNLTYNTRGQCYKTFLSMIYGFLHQARVFVRLDWKILPMTNTLADYENP